jgi:hypothetical protein
MDQSVMVFAGTAARASAIPTPSAGMVAYSTATSLQVYNGSAWNSIGGLTVVIPQTAVSAVSTITHDGVFTSDFTNYLLIVTGTTTASANIQLQFRVGGVTAATNYNAQFLYLSSTTVSTSRVTGGTSQAIGTLGPSSNSAFTNIYGPQIAAQTGFTSVNNYSGTATTPEYQQWSGNHSTATAYDGFILTTSSGTFTGNYALYGYNK